MPSLGDSAVIILLGLLLFGPKGLAQIARQLGKLMGEFRRASNEFRMQMEEELRISEQADRQKEIAKIEAAAPPPAPVLGTPVVESPGDDSQHRSIPSDQVPSEAVPSETIETASEVPIGDVEPLPIAVSGDLKIMPPATGLPQPRSSSLAPLIDSVPHADPADTGSHEHADQRPDRYTNGYSDRSGLSVSEHPASNDSDHTIPPHAEAPTVTPTVTPEVEETLHG